MQQPATATADVTHTHTHTHALPPLEVAVSPVLSCGECSSPALLLPLQPLPDSASVKSLAFRSPRACASTPLPAFDVAAVERELVTMEALHTAEPSAQVEADLSPLHSDPLVPPGLAASLNGDEAALHSRVPSALSDSSTAYISSNPSDAADDLTSKNPENIPNHSVEGTWTQTLPQPLHRMPKALKDTAALPHHSYSYSGNSSTPQVNLRRSASTSSSQNNPLSTSNPSLPTKAAEPSSPAPISTLKTLPQSLPPSNVQNVDPEVIQAINNTPLDSTEESAALNNSLHLEPIETCGEDLEICPTADLRNSSKSFKNPALPHHSHSYSGISSTPAANPRRTASVSSSQNKPPLPSRASPLKPISVAMSMNKNLPQPLNQNDEADEKEDIAPALIEKSEESKKDQFSDMKEEKSAITIESTEIGSESKHRKPLKPFKDIASSHHPYSYSGSSSSPLVEVDPRRTSSFSSTQVKPPLPFRTPLPDTKPKTTEPSSFNLEIDSINEDLPELSTMNATASNDDHDDKEDMTSTFSEEIGDMQNQPSDSKVFVPHVVIEESDNKFIDNPDTALPPKPPPKDDSKRASFQPAYALPPLAHSRSNSSMKSDDLRKIQHKQSHTSFQDVELVDPLSEEEREKIIALQQENRNLKHQYDKYYIQYSTFAARLRYFRHVHQQVHNSKQELLIATRKLEEIKEYRNNTTLNTIQQKIQQKVDLHRLIQSRRLSNQKLRPLVHIQWYCEVLLKDKIEQEARAKKQFEQNSEKLKLEIQRRVDLENKWFADGMNLAPAAQNLNQKAQRFIAEYYNVLPVWQEYINTVGRLNEELAQQQYKFDIKQHCLQQLQASMFQIIQLILKKYADLDEEMRRHEKMVEWHNQIAKMEDIQESVRLDKLCPWNAIVEFKWGNYLDLNIRKFIPSPGKSISAGSISLPFSLTEWKTTEHAVQFSFITDPKTSKICAPFAKGTYRTARHAHASMHQISNAVVKAFHLRRGLDKDISSAERVAKANAIVKHCALLFSGDLHRCGFKEYTLEYIDVWVAECIFPTVEAEEWDLPPETCLMVEPFVGGRFQKWVNNNMMIVGEDPEGMDNLMMQSFAHWTWERSGNCFIISDLQGVRHGEGGEKKWVLMDPAVHFAGDSQTAKELRDALRHDMDGDLGKKAVQAFCDIHICNMFCRSLGLRRIQ